jgi:hypothetical protein
VVGVEPTLRGVLLADNERRRLFLATPVHDVGAAGIETTALLGDLDWVLARRHVTFVGSDGSGTDAMSSWVYGCVGSSTRLVPRDCSTTCPAYITMIESAM